MKKGSINFTIPIKYKNPPIGRFFTKKDYILMTYPFTSQNISEGLYYYLNVEKS
jgi:hypothetical protein